MTRHATDPIADSELDERHIEIGRRPPRYQNGDTNNGNGANRIVWAVAGFAVVCLVTINGIMWSKLWDMSTSLTRLETQVELVLSKLPQ